MCAVVLRALPANQPSTEPIAVDARSFELRAVTRIEEGAEAVISYGEGKSNAELLRDYG